MGQLSLPEGAREESESMELQAMGGFSGGSNDARGGAVDQGGDIGEHDESDRALSIRGENVSGEAVAADNMVTGQGTSVIESGDVAARGGKVDLPENWASLSKSQQRNWWKKYQRMRRRGEEKE